MDLIDSDAIHLLTVAEYVGIGDIEQRTERIAGILYNMAPRNDAHRKTTTLWHSERTCDPAAITGEEENASLQPKRGRRLLPTFDVLTHGTLSQEQAFSMVTLQTMRR